MHGAQGGCNHHRGISTLVLLIEPVVGFDWYVTGYCISHFDVRWGLCIELNLDAAETDLFLKGLGSSPNGRIQSLWLTERSFSQIFSQLGRFCQLINLHLWGVNIFDSCDVNILQQLIAPGSELRYIFSFDCEFSLDTLQTLFDQSSLEELIINNDTMHFAFLFPHKLKNTNLKRLTITGDLIQPLAAVLPNITSLTYLRVNWPVFDSDVLVLIDLVQSHTTLEELELCSDEANGYELKDLDVDPTLTNLPQLIEIADNSRLVLIVEEDYYDYLPVPDEDDDIDEQHDENDDNED